jgi:ABC-type sugar transport system ATPase subunit
MSEIRLVNVTKRFGNTFALKNINLEISDNEFFIICGPPGVGKTTLLRTVAGLDNPDEGSVYIGNDLVNPIEPRDRNVAMVFENLALYPNKSAFDNIAFPLKQHKRSKEEIKRRVTEVSKMLHIEHLLDRNPGTFSGGERQRVAIARAIVRRPRVYLLDQPLANLDAKIRENMRIQLRRLASELGTIIYTTHDQQDLGMADRAAVLNMGALQQCGSPEELYSNPSNKMVAGFVGNPSMNFLKCSYVEEQEKAFLDHTMFRYEVTRFRDVMNKMLSKNDCILGLRPQDVNLVNTSSSKDAIEGTVSVTEPLGPSTIVTIQIGDDLVKVLIASDIDVKAGQTKYLEFDKEKLHIFDAETEKAII